MSVKSAYEDRGSTPGAGGTGPKSAAPRTARAAAKELGLKPRELALAMQLDVVRSVPGANGGPRRVPGEDLRRLKGAEGFPESLKERLRVVGAAEGAAMLGISPSRFARLARAGVFCPVRFYINRYRTVVWLYLAEDLRGFAERRSELLNGRFPAYLRERLAQGADRRARLWRHRRVEQLARQASGPWERAAVRASVLDEDVLARAVSDGKERALLLALRPSLTGMPSGTPAHQEMAADLCLAEDDDEILWHRVMLSVGLEEARASVREDNPAVAATAPAAAPSTPPAQGEPSPVKGKVNAEAERGHRPGQAPEPEPAVREHVVRGREEAVRRTNWRWRRPWPRRRKTVSRPAF